MNLTYNLIYAAHCNGTHHKIAMDSLRYLKNDDQNDWRKLFLTHVEAYVEGSKAPDKTFKDFRNHVLHVRDNFWGGAANKSAEWYDRFVHNLKLQNWREAVYSAGVLSHYYADAMHPFHTAQSEAESNIHRAVEWSISKSYDTLREQGIEQWPSLFVDMPEGEGWVKTLVKQNAAFSNQYYETLITHYNFDKGVVDPLEGFDKHANEAIAKILRLSIVSFSHVLDCAFAEAGVKPIKTGITAKSFLAGTKIPLRWITRKMADSKERKLVQAMYDELQDTGTVVDNLSADDHAIKNLYEAEVLSKRSYRAKQKEAHTLFASSKSERRNYKRSTKGTRKRDNTKVFRPDKTNMKQLKVELNKVLPTDQVMPTDSVKGKPSEVITVLNNKTHLNDVQKNSERTQRHNDRKPREKRYYLALNDAVADGPGVGDKTALRLAKLNIYTVADFIQANPEVVAKEISMRYVGETDIADWQHQANLMCHIAGLKAMHAKLLVASGVLNAEALASMNEDVVYSMLYTISLSEEGQKILRNKTLPSSNVVEDWIGGAKQFLRSKVA